MTVKHPGALEEVVSVLPLMKKEPIGAPYDLDAKEVVERTEVLESELSAKTVSKLSKKTIRAGGQDDVIDVEEQVGGVGAVSIDEE